MKPPVDKKADNTGQTASVSASQQMRASSNERIQSFLDVR